MTNTLTITHAEAVRLYNELGAILENKNLDKIQIVSDSSNIHVTILNGAPITQPNIEDLSDMD